MPGHFVCVCDIYTPTQQTYSVIHLAIQLSYLLVLLGLFYIYIAYVKQQLLHKTI